MSEGAGGIASGAVAVVIDDWALEAVPGLEQELAREGALVMRAFKGIPNPHLLRRYRGAAVVGGPDRTGLLARLERATASVAAPVIAILPRGVAPAPDLRGPGVVDLVPAGARGVGRRILLMAKVPVVTAGRAARPAEGAVRPPPAAPEVLAPPLDALAPGAGRGPATGVVAVASSTGGVWVLAALLRELSQAGRAVLVAQHMEAEFVPFFADWLQSASGWRTELVQDATPLAGGVVYLAAGARDLVLDGDVLRAMPASSRFVPCADRLLASVAERGGDATGVVLSGMGADGAGGLAEIARRGGKALCQAPASAVVPSMPESALRRTPSAIALPPQALPGAIALGQRVPDTSGASARR